MLIGVNMKYIVLLIFLASSVFASANTNELYPQLSIYKVPSDPQLLTRLSSQYDILRTSSNGADVLVPISQKNNFLKLAPQAQLAEKDISQAARLQFQKSLQLQKTESDEARYHTYSEVLQTLKELSEAHKDVTEYIEYGKSGQGLPLAALRVGKHLHDEPTKPRVLLTAATHGDEIITTEVLLSLLKTLLQQSNDESRFEKMLEQTEIVFIPVINPDGFTRQHRYDTGVDPNRSYPYPSAPNAKPSPSIEAEMAFVERYPIAGSLDFHAYSAVFLYPWGYTRDRLDSNWLKIFDPLTEKMAKTNDYGYGPISEVMYIARGSSCDYFFWKNKTVSIAVETGDQKSPDPSEFPKYIHEQEESTWMFIESFYKVSM